MDKNTGQMIDILAGYFDSQKEIAAAYLFGSYAQGQPRPKSDIDIALLFEPQERIFIHKKMELHHLALSRLLRRDLHLIAMNDAGELLLKQIFSKGRCIVANHPKRLAVFKMIAFAKIAEFGYFKPDFEQGFVRKLVQD